MISLLRYYIHDLPISSTHPWDRPLSTVACSSSIINFLLTMTLRIHIMMKHILCSMSNMMPFEGANSPSKTLCLCPWTPRWRFFSARFNEMYSRSRFRHKPANLSKTVAEVTGVVLKEEVESAVGHGLDKFGEKVGRGLLPYLLSELFFHNLSEGCIVDLARCSLCILGSRSSSRNLLTGRKYNDALWYGGRPFFMPI